MKKDHNVTSRALIRRLGQPFPKRSVYVMAALLIAAGVLLPIIAILILAVFPRIIFGATYWQPLCLATLKPRWRLCYAWVLALLA